MKRNNVEIDLRIKVRKYLEHLFFEDGTKEAEKETCILNKLSHSLRREVLIQMHGKVLEHFHFFKQNFSQEALDRSAQVMRKVRFAPGDDIFFVNIFRNIFLYFF